MRRNRCVQKPETAAWHPSVAQADIRERLANVGITAVASSPAAFAARIERDIARWTAVARAANVVAD